VLDLYHHAQHFYSTIQSHTANCCGRYKPIWTVSLISYNVSHPSCCKLAEVVASSSPPFSVKLSAWLPSSCNAAPLIDKATTELKEVAFHQPITQYQILCWYRAGRPVCWIYNGWGSYFRCKGTSWAYVWLSRQSAFNIRERIGNLQPLGLFLIYQIARCALVTVIQSATV